MTTDPTYRTDARRVCLLCSTVAALMAVPRAVTLAQEVTGTVMGTVVVRGSERPLIGASAVLGESSRVGMSDSAGRFRIVGVPPGDHVLTIRRIGFEPMSGRISVAAATDVIADIKLKASAPAQLEEVRVVADVRRWGTLAAMEHRRRTNGGGTFISGAELDSAAGRSLPAVLARKLAGVQIISYGRTGAALLSSGRGQMSGRELPLADPIDPRSPRACYAQVYLDGMRIYSIRQNGMAVPDLRDIHVESLAGVEYYAGEAQTPSEFAGEGAACGTILFWTK
jgi:hypothetical protein